MKFKISLYPMEHINYKIYYKNKWGNKDSIAGEALYDF